MLPKKRRSIKRFSVFRKEWVRKKKKEREMEIELIKLEDELTGIQRKMRALYNLNTREIFVLTKGLIMFQKLGGTLIRVTPEMVTFRNKQAIDIFKRFGEKEQSKILDSIFKLSLIRDSIKRHSIQKKEARVDHINAFNALQTARRKRHYLGE